MNLAPDLGHLLEKKNNSPPQQTKAYPTTSKVPKMAQSKAMHQVCINLLDEVEGKAASAQKHCRSLLFTLNTIDF